MICKHTRSVFCFRGPRVTYVSRLDPTWNSL